MSERLKISRRHFLVVGGGALVVPAALKMDLMGVGAVASWFTEIPPLTAETPRPRPNAGWLETQETHKVRPPLLDTTDGHREWLKHFFYTDPFIREVAKRAFESLFSGENKVKNERLGDVLKRHIEYAQGAYRERFHEAPPLGEAVHSAIISLAIVHSPYFSIKDIKKLGVEVDHANIPEDTSVFWVTKTQDKLPHLLPAPLSDCRSVRDILARCLGLDRDVHGAQNLFLSHEELYSLIYGLQEKERMPRGIRLALRASRTNEEKAEALSFWAGRYWELNESGREIVWYLEKFLKSKHSFVGDPKDIASGDDEYGIIPTGFFDQMVANDLVANKIGSRAGIMLTKKDLTKAEVERAVAFLNNPSYYEVRENSIIDYYTSLLGW